MADAKTWKGVTWKKGQRLPGARGRNKGVAAAVRENKRIKAELLAAENAARDAAYEAMRAPTVDLTKLVEKLGGEKKRRKRYPYRPPSGGELMEKIL